MHHHRVLSLAAALFVAPFATGCMAGGEESDDEVMDVEGPGLEEAGYYPATYMNCYHLPGFGMECKYTGGGSQALWIYDYDNTPATDGPLYTSSNVVNWANCAAPTGTPTFFIHVRAWSTYWSNFSELNVPCN